MIGVSQPKKPGRRQRATYAPIISSSAIYGVSSTNETFVNTPPRITSESINLFQFKLSAEDSEDKNLSFLSNETAPASMGNVSLALDGMLTCTPCADEEPALC